MLGLTDPVGQKAGGYPDDGEIVGVFRDFHFASLHNVIEPLILIYKPNSSPFLFVRFEGERVRDVLAYMESEFRALSRGYVFDYAFLDDKLNQLYMFGTGWRKYSESFPELRF